MAVWCQVTREISAGSQGQPVGNGLRFAAGAMRLVVKLRSCCGINVDDGGLGRGVLRSCSWSNNDGSRNVAAGGPDVAGILSFSDADVEAAGSVRPGDMDFLSNGTILIVGEAGRRLTAH